MNPVRLSISLYSFLLVLIPTLNMLLISFIGRSKSNGVNPAPSFLNQQSNSVESSNIFFIQGGAG